MTDTPSTAFLETGSWKWDANQIIAYVGKECLSPSIQRVGNDGKQDLRAVHAQIILPSLRDGDPFVTNRRQLVYIWVRTKHKVQGKDLRVPITDFFTALGWIISMVQSPVAPNTSIERILAFYVKWCSTIGDEYFVGHRQPNTASIAWLTLMEGQGSSALYTPHHDIFSVSSSLPGGNPVKLQAAEIRHECLMTLLAPRVLPKAPRHGQVQTDGTRTWVDWGHCAETLAVLCIYLDVPPERRMKGLAVHTNTIAQAPSFQSDLVRKSKKAACDNCKLLMQLAQIAYEDRCSTMQHEEDMNRKKREQDAKDKERKAKERREMEERRAKEKIRELKERRAKDREEKEKQRLADEKNRQARQRQEAADREVKQRRDDEKHRKSNRR